VFEANPLTLVFQEVPVAGGGTAPVQFQYSNFVTVLKGRSQRRIGPPNTREPTAWRRKPVIPAEAGIQDPALERKPWTPALRG
jgi:hypothetical protein